MRLRHHYESHRKPSVWRTLENTMLKFIYNFGQLSRYTELGIYIYLRYTHTHTHTHTYRFSRSDILQNRFASSSENLAFGFGRKNTVQDRMFGCC